MGWQGQQPGPRPTPKCPLKKVTTEGMDAGRLFLRPKTSKLYKILSQVPQKTCHQEQTRPLPKAWVVGTWRRAWPKESKTLVLDKGLRAGAPGPEGSLCDVSSLCHDNAPTARCLRVQPLKGGNVFPPTPPGLHSHLLLSHDTEHPPGAGAPTWVSPAQNFQARTAAPLSALDNPQAFLTHCVPEGAPSWDAPPPLR